MVTNYKTCNYYYNKGVKYAILSKEITKEEIIEILNKSKIISMIEIISLPTVAFSKRKLITNYYKNLSKPSKEKLTVVEKLTQDEYELKEEPAGTGFISKKITNGTSVIKDLYDNNASYIIIKEYGLDIIDFNELLKEFGICERCVNIKNKSGKDCSLINIYVIHIIFLQPDAP